MAYEREHYEPTHYDTKIVVPQHALLVPIKYIKGYALVKRNGEIIHYCTPYTPFRPPREVETW